MVGTEFYSSSVSQGADPMLRNYRKETSFDIARQAGLVDMVALLERTPKKTLLDRDSTTKNRERDIKQVRKLEIDEQPTISRAEVRYLCCVIFLEF
jgi:hypothetical protein